jgi:hypothetical protein
MSYDLEIVKPRHTIDPLIVVENVFKRDVDERDPHMTEEIDGQTRDAIISTLVSKNPRFEIFPPTYITGPATYRVGSQEQVDYVELTDSDSGIEIMIFGDSIGIGIAYWHTGEKAKAVLQELWAYLDVIQSTLVCLMYDEQMGQILNLSSDFKKVLSTYTQVVRLFKDASD